MPKVTIVSAVWPATGARFMQAFESIEIAKNKYNDLKEDSGAEVSLIKTEFNSIEDLGQVLMGYDKKTRGQTH